MTTKRELRRDMVLNVLAKGPKDGLTLVQIQNRTGLSWAACSRALRDLREDPTVVFVTVPTAASGYRYKVAATVADVVPGTYNQAMHLHTRATSMVKVGEAIEGRATNTRQMRLGSRMVTAGEDLRTSIERMLVLLKELEK